MNPARSFASALPAGLWGDLWVYFTARVLGMQAAAAWYVFRRGTTVGCLRQVAASGRPALHSLRVCARSAQEAAAMTMPPPLRCHHRRVGCRRGSAAAFQLARAGLRVALVEKGGPLPQDGSTLDFNRVVQEGLFKSQRAMARTITAAASARKNILIWAGRPNGTARRSCATVGAEFSGDPAHQCPEWPITYDDLLPYYEQAERLLGVRGFDGEPDLRRIAERLVRRTPSWRFESLPLGLSPGIGR